MDRALARLYYFPASLVSTNHISGRMGVPLMNQFCSFYFAFGRFGQIYREDKYKCDDRDGRDGVW